MMDEKSLELERLEALATLAIPKGEDFKKVSEKLNDELLSNQKEVVACQKQIKEIVETAKMKEIPLLEEQCKSLDNNISFAKDSLTKVLKEFEETQKERDDLFKKRNETSTIAYELGNDVARLKSLDYQGVITPEQEQELKEKEVKVLEAEEKLKFLVNDYELKEDELNSLNLLVSSNRSSVEAYSKLKNNASKRIERIKQGDLDLSDEKIVSLRMKSENLEKIIVEANKRLELLTVNPTSLVEEIKTDISSDVDRKIIFNKIDTLVSLASQISAKTREENISSINDLNNEIATFENEIATKNYVKNIKYGPTNSLYQEKINSSQTIINSIDLQLQTVNTRIKEMENQSKEIDMLSDALKNDDGQNIDAIVVGKQVEDFRANEASFNQELNLHRIESDNLTMLLVDEKQALEKYQGRLDSYREECRVRAIDEEEKNRDQQKLAGLKEKLNKELAREELLKYDPLLLGKELKLGLVVNKTTDKKPVAIVPVNNEPGNKEPVAIVPVNNEPGNKEPVAIVPVNSDEPVVVETHKAPKGLLSRAKKWFKKNFKKLMAFIMTFIVASGVAFGIFANFDKNNGYIDDSYAGASLSDLKPDGVTQKDDITQNDFSNPVAYDDSNVSDDTIDYQKDATQKALETKYGDAIPYLEFGYDTAYWSTTGENVEKLQQKYVNPNDSIVGRIGYIDENKEYHEFSKDDDMTVANYMTKYDVEWDQVVIGVQSKTGNIDQAWVSLEDYCSAYENVVTSGKGK